jgi:cytochrome P450
MGVEMGAEMQTFEMSARSPELVARYRDRYGERPDAPLEDLVHIEDPAFHVDPWSTYARLQREAPVYWDERHRTWIITRHADVRTVTRTPEIFSSAHGILLFDGVKTDGGLGAAFDADGEQLFLTDPPRHHELRRIMGTAFNRRAMRQLEESIERFTRELLDEITPGEPFEWSEGVASVLPIRVVCSMLGVPDDDPGLLRDMRRWSDKNELLSTVDLDPAQISDVAGAFSEMNDYLAEMFEHKRRHPGDDFLTALLADNLDERQLSEGNLVGFAQALIAAGTDTTRSMLGGIVAHLCEFPVAQRALRDDPGLIPVAMDEVLRWSPPARGFARHVLTDTEIAGQPIRGGERVWLAYDAANRDPAVFEQPHEFDVRRVESRLQMAFGFGTHVCIAAGLVRLESAIVTRQLLERFSSFAWAGTPRRIETFMRNGWDEVPVVFG